MDGWNTSLCSGATLVSGRVGGVFKHFIFVTPNPCKDGIQFDVAPIFSSNGLGSKKAHQAVIAVGLVGYSRFEGSIHAGLVQLIQLISYVRSGRSTPDISTKKRGWETQPKSGSVFFLDPMKEGFLLLKVG